MFKLPRIELLNKTFKASEEKKSCFKAIMSEEAKEFFNFIIEKTPNLRKLKKT